MARRKTELPLGEGSAVMSDAVTGPQELFAPFLRASKVGFGICDKRLRYQAINRALAASNSIPARAHLGNTVREVLGEVAPEIEFAFERVLLTERPVLREIAGKIPRRPEVVHWIANYFPVKDATGKIRQLVRNGCRSYGTEGSPGIPSSPQPGFATAKVGDQRRLAQQLDASIDQYHATLKATLRILVRPIWQSADRVELLSQSAQLLEHLPVVSLKSANTIRDLCRQFDRDPKLRRGLFSRIAECPKLQNDLLQVLESYPEAQAKLVNELAKSLTFRRRLWKAAGK